MTVTLYENPGFTGRSVTLDIGQHRFFTTEDFNDVAASIQIPAGLAAFIYEHADDIGGYGTCVDLMEDCADLSAYELSKKVSYVTVFSTANDQGLVWARAIGSGPSFVPGHWERRRASGQLPPNPGVGAVGPPVPSHAPPPPPPPTTSIQVRGSTSVITALGQQDRLEASFWQYAVTNQFGVIGSDYRGVEYIGSAAFERASNNPVIPDFFNFWYPQIQPRDHRERPYFKRTLIGTVADVHVADISGTFEDHDLNISIAPDARHQFLITDGHPREYTDIMSAEYHLTFRQFGQSSCNDAASVEEFNFIEAEILPSSDLRSGVAEGLRDRIAAAGNRMIGVYGPWIYDKGHCCHAEIHPAEQIWWRVDSQSTTIYHFNVICDASKRFWWRNQMDDGTKLKPWGAPPIVGMFAIAFEIDPATSPLVFETSDISGHNVANKSNGQPVAELTYQGITLVRFVPHTDSVTVSFEQVGTGDNGRIRGFLVLETSVGTLTQTVVNDQYPPGTDVNAIDQDDERTVFDKQEGHYMFTVSQHVTTPST